MAAVTAVYAIAAFTNLGSLKAPQTTWVSGSADEAGRVRSGARWSASA